jgi:lipopolysaccharide transport system ATP-binding protein
MSQPVIKVENISKLYHLGMVGTGTLAHDLNRWWKMNILGREDPYSLVGETNDRAHKGKSEYVWALKDINFEVEQGEVLGIIGRNGAGKSTLLKLLSRITSPTTGNIKIRGRVASLLEIGTGFHPELTGRENVYMNGTIMGMKKREIDAKFDEIVDFAGVERFIDTPVKRYSSGMMVRLGFAVAAHLEPEILVVDEVLAVGDAEFQKKAIGKMHEVSQGHGRTVLFVSHNMQSIKAICSDAILLENGGIKYSGGVNEVINKYVEESNANIPMNYIKEAIKYSNNKIIVSKILINEKQDTVIHIKDSAQYKLHFKISGTANITTRIELSGKISDQYETPLATFTPGHSKKEHETFLGPFVIKEDIILPTNILKGTYYLSLFIVNPGIEQFCEVVNSIKLEIDGVATANGHVFEYKNQNGFLLLK